ncbi:S8 family serine peptidase [Bacillus sp. UNCCL81]|uniref:S8 family serine peptidase n=1 Tax=Bacillus sp. UNCCL81 TaxID=1502755 RepID=UPI0008DF5968|nr:S8 family serine peptidase [Bacillus sp. UNCCL81]SFD51686.1 Peptidase inhibitor I9 [Bacillus sp. UNCCL81]
MERSKIEKFSRVLKGSAAAAIFLGMLLPTSQKDYVSATTIHGKSSEQILASLTQEQRDALTKLKSMESYGLQGFDKKDLNSSSDISVIVEFKSKPEKVAILESALEGKSLTSTEAKNRVKHDHTAFEEDLAKILPASKEKSGRDQYKITRSFDTVYNGVSMKLPANEVEKLLKSDSVQAVYKSVEFSIDPPETPNSTEEQDSIKRIESIPFLGVDKLHEEGITGKGVKVGVIDTGVDYNHPDLKDAFKGGYDLVDNDPDPMETTYDDWKKSGRPETDQNLSPYYTSHGTHVSGTIAGRAKNTGGVAVKGIAPDADLFVYRVLGPYGTGELEDILAGIEKAVEDKMDVINLSLGANINDPMYPTSTAINYAVLNGVTASVSAGNSGPNSYTLGSPGAAALALTVGASSAPIPVTKYTGVLNGIETPFQLSTLYNDFVSDLKVFNGQTLDVVDLGVGNDSDYLNKDVAGKVVFVSTGVIGTQSKTVYAKNHGARAIIAYSNIPNAGPSQFVKEEQNFIPAFSMSYEQGLDFKAKLAAGHTKLTFKDLKEVNTDADKLASFSSRGPSRSNYDMKPEITAPGVSVLSSVPAYSIYKNDQTNYKYAYSRMSGTSMAAPHVTGISALLLQANPALEPGDIKTILMNTAKPLADSYSVFDVGAGRVDPYRAVHTGMKIQVQDETVFPLNGENLKVKELTGGLSFGSHYANEDILVEKKVNFTNVEDKLKKFNVDVNFQTGINGSLNASENGVSVSIPTEIKVQSLDTKKIPVSISVPANAKAGIYEGYIIVTNKDDKNEQYRIPFSVRTTEEGFNSTTLSYKSMSPSFLHVKRSFSANQFIDMIFNFKSPMKRMDIVLQDGKTGNDLGVIGTIDLSSSYDGTNYLLSAFFNGTYHAYTDNTTQPISPTLSYVKPGPYRIKIIGTSARDKVFVNYNDLYIDNNIPTMSTSFDGNESPVIEYQPGQKTIPVQVNVTDQEVANMNEFGMKVDQSINKVNYSVNGNFNPVLPVGVDGKIDLSVPMNESSTLLTYTLNGLDGANNTTQKKNYYFVKAGSPYGYVKTDNVNVKMGDTVNATFVLNNVQNLKSAEWTLNNIGQNFEVLDAKANEALKDLGATVTVETSGNNSKVKLALDEAKTVSGKIPAINLKLKVKSTTFAVSAPVNPIIAYTNDQGNRITLSSAGMEWLIQPTFSEVFGTLGAEASVYNRNWNWTTSGATVRVIDGNGKVYDGSSSLVSYGDYKISNLPLTTKSFTWELKVPGHFTVKREIPIGLDKNGTIWGQTLQYFSDKATAGDVNGDDVIDVYDALYIQTYWGTNKRSADINNDGTVNATDFQFVEKNYLKQNPSNQNAPIPKKKYKTQTIDTIKGELGI